MGLTPKRMAFVNAIVSGMNPSEAYREAGYSCRMGARAVAVEANRLLRNPDISLAVMHGQAEAVKRALWSRETALERLDEVNRIALEGMRETGLTGRDNVSGFMESFDRLQAMTEEKREADNAPKIFLFDREEAERLKLQ